MNTQSNTLHESSLPSQAIAPAVIPASRRFYWSVRRELWENRSIYLAPLAAAAVFLLGFLISLGGLPGRMAGALALDPMRQRALIERPYSLAALMIMAVAIIVAFIYCLEALHSERRDRSILFWKSLPVSDLTAVLAKASIPLLVVPVVAFVLTALTQWIMLLLSSAALLASGMRAAALWTHLPLFQMWLVLLYHLVVIHGLWYFPIYCWLLLVSAWARRAPFLWAVLPPFAIGIVEKIAFNTSHFAAFMGYRFGAGPAGEVFTAHTMAMDQLAQLTPGRFLASAGLWLGLAVAAVFLVAAAQLRRYRGPF